MLQKISGSIDAAMKALAGRCPACGIAAGHSLCQECSALLKPRLAGYCPQCGLLQADEKAPPSLCGHCLTNPKPWDSLVFYAEYAGLLRDIILHFKFHGGLGVERLLQECLLRGYELHRTDAVQPDLVVPVPLHRSRLLWRGFNQSLQLARMAASSLALPLRPEALRRTRATRQQYRLSRKERLENIKGAFAGKRDLLEGKSVLLVDDVLTTGATLEEAARELKRSGAARVEVLVLARTAEG